MIVRRRVTRSALALAALALVVAGAGLARPAPAGGETHIPPSALATAAATPASDGAAPVAPVYYVVTRTRAMALTFDISWGTQAVGEVLSVLRDYRQRATFFLSGPWSAQHPEIVRAIARDGHEVASHGQEHVNLSGQSDDAIAKNLAEARAILTRITAQEPRFFRPPNGDFDARVVRIAAASGQETVIWSIDSLDWLRRDPTEIARRVVAGAFPGAIILFHASDSAPATAAALPQVFRELAQMGYRLVPLGDLLAYGPPAREDPRGRPVKPNMAGAGR